MGATPREARPPRAPPTLRRTEAARRARTRLADAPSPSLARQPPSRGGAAAARWAHNPKVGGSNPPPATRYNAGTVRCRRCCIFSPLSRLNSVRTVGRMLRLLEESSTSSATLLNLLSISSIQSDAPNAAGAALGFALSCNAALSSVQPSMVRPMWCAGQLFPLQVPVDTRESGTGQISWTIRRLAARRCRSVQIPRGVGTSGASKRAFSGCRRSNAPADALIPVPLHPTRLRQRGFNQSLLLAQHAGDLLGIEVKQALNRTRRTDAQVNLGSRTENGQCRRGVRRSTGFFRRGTLHRADR